MLKAIALDFDGVILESVDLKTQAFIELFQDYPEHLDAIVKLHLEQGGLSRFEKFKIIYRDYLQQPLHDKKLQTLGQKFSEIVYRKIHNCPFVIGAYEFLQFQSQQYQLFIVSGTPEKELQDIVKKRELGGFFTEVLGSPKSKTEIIKYILLKYDLKSSEIIAIGDSINDLEGAYNNNVSFIGRAKNSNFHPFPKNEILAVVENLQDLQNNWYKLTKENSSE